MLIGAIIQARMGSTRLPGKVLRNILDKPMLWHLIKRLQKSNLIEKILIATTRNEIDHAIIKVAQETGVDYFTGNENDVLDRYYQTAKEFHIDPVVRITADCPLIDPKVTDRTISYYVKNNGMVDYVSNAMPPTYPDGLDTEVFSFAALEKAWKDAKTQSEREYVTAYIWKNKQIFRVANVVNEDDLSYMRWTVDEDKDFLFVTEIYKGLYKNEGNIFYMEDIVNFVKTNPELLSINQGIKRNEGYIKSLQQESVNLEKELIPWRISERSG